MWRTKGEILEARDTAESSTGKRLAATIPHTASKALRQSQLEDTIEAG